MEVTDVEILACAVLRLSFVALSASDRVFRWLSAMSRAMSTVTLTVYSDTGELSPSYLRECVA
jgi:hypothetical protein